MKRLREKLGSNSGKPGKSASVTGGHTHLSDEERALWRHVAISVEPVNLKSRIPRRGSTIAADDLDVPQPRRLESRTATPTASNSQPPIVNRPVGKPATARPLADFDARKVKKIAKGRTEIEARLDLHGLRQDDAHARLRRFLRDAYANGLKHVLVITGKGREIDDRTAAFADTFDRPERGVLRRNVPRWLADPELRMLVVSYISASPRHGGDGAFYIELRRAR